MIRQGGKAPQALWHGRIHPTAASTTTFRDHYRREQKSPLKVDTLYETDPTNL